MLRTVLSLVLCAILAPAASAAIYAPYSGNTNPGNSDVSGTVNWAFLDRSGSVAGDSWGTGIAGFDLMFSAAIDTTANYLYLYQLTDTSVDISTFAVAEFGTITSFGYFANTGFADDGGAVTSSNVFGVPDPPVFGDPDGPNFGVTSPSILTGQAGNIAPTAVGLSGTSFVAIFVTPSIGPGGRSTLLGFTTNDPPAIVPTTIKDGALPATGSSIGPTDGLLGSPPALPEPASMIVWGLGAGLIGVVGYFKRRR